MSDGYAVSLGVVDDGVNAWHLIASDALDGQLRSGALVGAFLCAVGLQLQAFHPRCLAVEVVDNLFCQRDGGARWRVELVYVVCLLHAHVVLWEAVHYFCQVTVHRREYRHADREV